MAWITPADADLLLQFLEPNIEENRKGALKRRDMSFYSSEMKNVSQIQTCLKGIRQAGRLPGDDEKSRARYYNSLTNFGLLSGGAEAPQLTSLGTTVLQIIEGIDPDDTTALRNTTDAAILRGLLDAQATGSWPTERAKEFFPQVLYNVQLFVDAMESHDLSGILGDLDLLLFFQCIHSAGYEVRRYWRLSTEQRDRARQVWTDLAAKNAPDPEPRDLGGKTAWAYLAPLVNNVVQKDIRFRVCSFLTAYLSEQERLGDAFPYLTPSLELFFRRRSVSGASKSRLRRGPPSTPTEKTTLARQRIITGCPGSGKSRRAERDAAQLSNAVVMRTTFHSETSHFDFVGNYKPVPVYERTQEGLIQADGTEGLARKPYIDYRFAPGPFSRVLLDALLNPEYQVVLLIEELNRANASAVFGDLLQLLDRDPDGVSAYDIVPSPDLAAFLGAEGIDVSRGLRLPSNLFLWATMNAADQGVFPLDSAFRRRWTFEYLGHTDPCAYGATASVPYGGRTIPWDAFRERINNRLIENNIPEDKLIGAYFLTASEVSDPAAIAHKLFHYLWEDALRFSHEAMTRCTSFARLLEEYRGGAGSPLTIEW